MSKVLHRLEDLALILALGSMLLMALVQIFLRNFFDMGLLWVDPFLRVLVLWIAMLGGMVATRQGNHISIDAVSRYLPEATRNVASIAVSLASSAICLAIAWTSIEFIAYEYEDQTIAFASVPTWLCQAILPFGFSVIGFRFLVGAGKTAMTLVTSADKGS